MSNSSNNILDPSALLSLLPSLLPVSNKSLSSPQDAIAVLLHTIMSALGFRLIAVDESSAPDLPSATVLPAEWNKNGPAHYTFKYRHDQSSLEFVLKVSKLGSRTLFNAIALEASLRSYLVIELLHWFFCRAIKSLRSILIRMTLSPHLFSRSISMKQIIPSFMDISLRIALQT